MTTLYDPPLSPQHESATQEEYETTDSEIEDRAYELDDYDLDVIDDSLLHPHNPEFIDHFGFKIQVRTDDESSSDDDSENGMSDTDNKTRRKTPGNTTSNTTVSDDDSIDTNITTPHNHYHHTNERDLHQNSAELTTKTLINTIPILKSPPSPKLTTTNYDNTQQQQTSSNSNSNNLSSSIKTENQPVIPSEAITDNPLFYRSSDESQYSNKSDNSQFSFNDKAYNKQRPSYIQSPSLSRPSQSFQQRQSTNKRFSEIPATINPRSSTMLPKDFDKMVSKFRRFSHNEHKYDSTKQQELIQEALKKLESDRESDKNIDWDFWAQVISNFSIVIETQMEDLKQHLIKGIPSSLRGLIWQIVSKSRDSFDMETEYRRLIEKDFCQFEKQIRRDITRTFPEHPYFKQESGKQALFNVAKAYSNFDREVGYCQGLAFIIGILLLHMSSEEAVFCVLVKLMSKYGLRGQFTPKMETLHQHLYQFDNIFQQTLPVVHKHMENEGVAASTYASHWFLTLFSYRCPMEIACRVLDLVLVEGAQVLIQIGLVIMTRNQEAILKLQFEPLIEFLSNDAFKVFGNNVNGFVEDVYRIELPARFMVRLARQFAFEETHSSQSMSMDDNLQRVNGQLLSRLRSAENSLQILQVENNELTQQVIDSKMKIAKSEDTYHELLQTKTEAERRQIEVAILHKSKVNELEEEIKNLIEQKGSLESQLTETEVMLINMKMTAAERETEFESLKRQLAVRKRDSRSTLNSFK